MECCSERSKWTIYQHAINIMNNGGWEIYLYYKDFTSTLQTKYIILGVFERLKAPLKVPLKEHNSVVRYSNAPLFKKRKKLPCNATFRPDISAVWLYF